jgi:hypothetical protein
VADPKHLLSQPLTRKQAKCYVVVENMIMYIDLNKIDADPIYIGTLLLTYDPSRVVIFSYRRKKKDVCVSVRVCVYVFDVSVNILKEKVGF